MPRARGTPHPDAQLATGGPLEVSPEKHVRAEEDLPIRGIERMIASALDEVQQ